MSNLKFFKRTKLDWKKLDKYNSKKIIENNKRLFFDEYGYPINIPENIVDCVSFLNEMDLDYQEKEHFKNLNETDAVMYYFPLRNYIINYWIKIPNKYDITNSLLYNYFVKNNITFSDDMGNIIICCFHRFLNGNDMKVNEQINNLLLFYAKFN